MSVYVVGRVLVTACAAATNKNSISGCPLSVVHRYIISRGSDSEKWKIKNTAPQKGLKRLCICWQSNMLGQEIMQPVR